MHASQTIIFSKFACFKVESGGIVEHNEARTYIRNVQSSANALEKKNISSIFRVCSSLLDSLPINSINPFLTVKIHSCYYHHETRKQP